MHRLLLIALFPLLLTASYARAEEAPKPDDSIVLSLSAEDWVTTKTARVTANVEAAVTSGTAGTVRADMMKSVNDIAKSDWRLTSFTRSLDQTGLERWSATYEARVPEEQLNGLNDNAKKLSKAGMQLTIGDIDFSPTLDEMETARAALRTKIFKSAADQLLMLNTTLAGRNYRIALIDFEGNEPMPIPPRPRFLAGAARPMNAMIAAAPAQEDQLDDRAQKITLTARVVFSAASPVVIYDKH
jgi:hypothetical protein